MKIEIRSHPEAARRCDGRDVILIVNTGRRYEDVTATQTIQEKARNCLLLEFDEFQANHFRTATEGQLRQAIEFARDKGDLLVSCTAGIARSSGTAFVVLCSKMEPEEAIKQLDTGEHAPNKAVVQMGCKILSKPTMPLVMARFMETLRLLGWAQQAGEI